MIEKKANLIGKGKKFGIVVSKFNELITKELLEGCKEALLQHLVNPDDIHCFWVPGALEIPLVAKKLAQSKKYHAVICLGAVIRGETPHFEYVASQTSRGIMSVSLSTEIPVIFGIITADTSEQAFERAGLKEGNKGRLAALHALEMVNLLEEL